MLFEGIRVDENVVKVSDGEFVKIFANDIIDVGLEGAGGVAKTQRHDEIFEMAVAGSEGGFVFISQRNSEAVEGFTDI